MKNIIAMQAINISIIMSGANIQGKGQYSFHHMATSIGDHARLAARSRLALI